MAFTYEELQSKTVAQLRDIAENLGDLDALHGYSTMHKEQLLPAVCTALGIEAHAHHEVVGVDKRKIKAQIRRLKGERDAALAAGDRTAYRRSLRAIHRCKGELRRHTV
ncbi:MAG: hypothetical protein JSV95_11935 [Gemmatimonadota bacterium]|nr:MAG: hypothetical protein JSV95_11935 [Gemmatimonadota bacterium]